MKKKRITDVNKDEKRKKKYYYNMQQALDGKIVLNDEGDEQKDQQQNIRKSRKGR